METEAGLELVELLVCRALKVQPEEPPILDVPGDIFVIGVDQERDPQPTVRSGTRAHGPGAFD
jgi:hypothetical protein